MKRRSIAVLVVLMTAGCGDPPPGPGVVLGAGVVDKTLFLDEPALGDVRSISFGQFTADGSAPIVVAGRAGAAFLNSTGEVRHLVRFDGLLINPVPVDVNGDGEYEFMDRGGGWQPVSLVDSQGQVIWRFEGEGFAAPNEMAAADLDGDGLLDFVVGLNGGGGVVRLDHQGRTVWTVDATNAFSVAMFEDDRGEPAVVHSDARSIRVRDASGALTNSLAPGFVTFSTTVWPAAGPGRRLTGTTEGTLQVVDVGSGVLASFDGGNLRSDASVVSFGLAPNQQYVAAESTIRATGRRSVLVIFQADGTRLYEEVFASAYLALAARPLADQTESLLVGAGSRVWNLRVKPPAANE